MPILLIVNLPQLFEQDLSVSSYNCNSVVVVVSISESFKPISANTSSHNSSHAFARITTQIYEAINDDTA